MKLSISVNSQSRGRIIFNPTSTKENDTVIRAPKDTRKVLYHFQKFARLQFPIRFWKKEAPGDEVVYSALAEIVSKDNDKAAKSLFMLEAYLKHNKWKLVKTTRGNSIWTNPKLKFLSVVVTPFSVNSRGVSFTVEVIGLETKSWRKAERKRLGIKVGPKTNLIHEQYLKEQRT